MISQLGAERLNASNFIKILDNFYVISLQVLTKKKQKTKH